MQIIISNNQSGSDAVFIVLIRRINIHALGIGHDSARCGFANIYSQI